MLAHRVDFGDRRATCEKRFGQPLLFGKRYLCGWCDPVGRSAAGYESEHEIVGASRIRERECFERGGNSRRIGNWMAGFDHTNNPGRTSVAMSCDGDASDAAWWQSAFFKVIAFGDLGHRACGLAGCQNDGSPGSRRRWQMRGQALRRMRRRDCGLVQAFEEDAG